LIFQSKVEMSFSNHDPSQTQSLKVSRGAVGSTSGFWRKNYCWNFSWGVL